MSKKGTLTMKKIPEGSPQKAENATREKLQGGEQGCDTVSSLVELPYDTPADDCGVRLNNAATTPPFQSTLSDVCNFLLTYGALHRGAGRYADKTCETVDRAVAFIERFFGLTKEHALLFTENTTSAINLFARTLKLSSDDMVLISLIEHTSNNLPWLYNSGAQIVHVGSLPDGSLDLDDLASKLREYRGRVKCVALTGASNLTGYIPDVKSIAKLVHEAGALLFVDAAQLAPHRPVNMGAQGIDALACSAHKLYAPFGLGVLALPKRLLPEVPVDPGGGSIDMISENGIVWAPPHLRHQAGTWNATGIVALASSLNTLTKCRFERIIEHERKLTRFALEHLSVIPGLTLYVAPEKYEKEDRIGTIPFNLKGYHHALLSAILAYGYCIENRSGTICNHRLVRRWFTVSDTEQRRIEGEIARGNRLASYGIVRVSTAVFNIERDIEWLIYALKYTVEHGPNQKYKPVPAEETFVPSFYELYNFEQDNTERHQVDGALFLCRTVRVLVSAYVIRK